MDLTNGCNFVGQQLATLSNIVGSCCVRLRVALGLSVKKYLYTKRRCHNELESVLLWLPFVIVTEETGYEYWRTVKMKTTVFSLWVQFLGIADGATAIIIVFIRLTALGGYQIFGP